MPRLASVRGLVNPVGLHDLDRRPRPAADAYRQLLRELTELPAFPEGGREDTAA